MQIKNLLEITKLGDFFYERILEIDPDKSYQLPC